MFRMFFFPRGKDLGFMHVVAEGGENGLHFAEEKYIFWLSSWLIEKRHLKTEMPFP